MSSPNLEWAKKRVFVSSKTQRQWMRSLHGHCEAISRKAPTSLVSVSCFPTDFHAQTHALLYLTVFESFGTFVTQRKSHVWLFCLISCISQFVLWSLDYLWVDHFTLLGWSSSVLFFFPNFIFGSSPSGQQVMLHHTIPALSMWKSHYSTLNTP